MKDQDQFAVNVGLTYNNKTEYKTYVGAVVSIFVYLLVIAFVVYVY